MEAIGGKRSLTGPGPAGETPSAGSINANHRSPEPSAPSGDLLRKERRELLAVAPILECNGMKPLLGPADIHTDDDGTKLALIHTDSRARKDSRHIFLFPVFYTISNLRPCYTMPMLKRTLNKTNPYLADPARRRTMFQMTVYTSTDIEGVKLTSSDLNGRIKPSRRITPHESAKSSRSRR